ncbi:DUF3034 family protein [Novosphingobium sp.]|uniref:DUF3034 family protein n=1 Tax=Novosphingobium sp. TaxID=1874826 RepID=UPI002636EDAE|nr:DUF3034 family protein [Novosphingobium sp.]
MLSVQTKIAIAISAGIALCAIPFAAAHAAEAPAADTESPAMAAADGVDSNGPASEPLAPETRQSVLPQGGRLLLTGGVSTIEGAGGGGIVPWALIGSYATRNQIGASAFVTGVDTQDFTLASYGGAVSFYNRLELSVARQNFNLREVGAAIGLGNRYTVSQTIIGAKLRLFGDAVLDQDTLLPQVAVGVQYKINDDRTVVGGALGLKRKGVDIYASATKIILSQSLLLNATLRLTKANQFGILGFGGLGGKDQAYKPQFEGSAALLLTRKLAIGGEYRTKSNRLEGALGGTSFREENAYDFFVAYAPTRNISITAAYARLGQIALARQNGAYVSLQLGF